MVLGGKPSGTYTIEPMGIIADTLAAQLADLKRRSDENDQRMLETLARARSIVDDLAKDEPVSEEEMIAEAILLLKEHGYTVIGPKA